MPPRKRARVSRAASPTSQTSPNPSSPPRKSSLADVPTPETNDLNDPWTDEEEAALFKALIQHKPTGIHKHFRLLSVYQYLIENGHVDPRNAHTRPSGIWAKLATLYDLEVLDEREDARQLDELDVPEDVDEDGGKDGSADEEEDDDDDVYSEAANKIPNRDFGLPDGDFGDLKWRARFPGARGESPPALAHLNLADVPPVRFTPSFSVEPEVIPTGRAGRRAAAGQRERGQKARTPVASSKARTGARRKSARTAGSPVAEEEGDDEEGEGEEAEDDEEGEEEDEGGDEDEEEDGEEEEEDGEEEEEDGEEEEEESDNEEDDEGTPARSTRAARSRPSTKTSGRASRSTKGRGK